MKQRFVILYAPGPGWIAGKSLFEQPLKEHTHYIHELFKRGELVMAGPFPDSSGAIAVIDVQDADEARERVAKDPAVISKVFTADLRPLTQVDWEHWSGTLPGHAGRVDC